MLAPLINNNQSVINGWVLGIGRVLGVGVATATGITFAFYDLHEFSTPITKLVDFDTPLGETLLDFNTEVF